MKKFAVFDIDGTVFRSALYHDVVDVLAQQGKLSDSSLQEIETKHDQWKKRSHPEAFWDYVNSSIEHFEKSFGKLSRQDFLSAAKTVFDAKKDHIYLYPKVLLNKLKSEGYFIIAISGSYQEIVEWFAKHHGIDLAIGSQYLYENEFVKGIGTLSHHKKHEILQEIIRKNDLTTEGSYAIGDTQSDISILEAVKNPIAFNPNKQLFDFARQNGWKIVIERKNMIYELEQKEGKYTLK